MSFQTKKEQKASERFILTRIVGRRLISALLSDEGSGIYQYAFKEPLRDVKRNGVSLTGVSGIPANNDEYSYENDVLTLKLATAPDSTDEIIVIEYYLFYTTGKVRIAGENPEDLNSQQRIWKPRVLTDIFLGQSVKNNLYGSLSTSITNFAIANADNDFQRFLTSNDSFNKSDISVWIGINDVLDVKRIFSGYISDISVNKKEIRLKIKDLFSALDEKCLMGDTAEESYFLKQSGSFSSVDPNRAGEPIPYIAAPLSQHKTVSDSDMIHIVEGQNVIDWQDVDGTHTVTIASDFYSPADLAAFVATRMNSQTTTTTYTGTWNSRYRKFIFQIDSGSFTFLWASGVNAGNSIGLRLAYYTAFDQTSIDPDFLGGALYQRAAISGSAVSLPVERFDLDSLINSVNILYSPYSNYSTNRRWSVGRFNSDGPRVLNFDIQVGTDLKTAITTETRGDSGSDIECFHAVRFTGSNNNIRVGDSFKWTNAAETKECYAICVRDREFSLNNFGIPFTHAFVTIDQKTTGSDYLTLNAGDTWHTNDAPAVVLKSKNGGRFWYLFYEKHFTTVNTTLDSGNIWQYIQLKNNAELDMIYWHEDLDEEPTNVDRPSKYKYRGYPIFYTVGTDRVNTYKPENAITAASYEIRIRTGAESANNGHADVLKKICQSTGIPVNASTFTAAQTGLDVQTAFSMPKIDETDFGTYREYAEDILRSTLSILVVNNSFELEYYLLKPPAGVFGTNARIYLRDTLDIDINYEDIVTEIIAKNDHYNSERILDQTNSPSVSRKSNKSRYLHGVERVITIDHVLEQIETRIDDILNLRNNRIAIYKWSEATDKIDAILGDDVIFESKQILGGDSSVNLKIMTIDKSTGRINVEASDLGDLT